MTSNCLYRMSFLPLTRSHLSSTGLANFLEVKKIPTTSGGERVLNRSAATRRNSDNCCHSGDRLRENGDNASLYLSRGVVHLSNQGTFIYFCVTPKRYRARSLRDRFPDGKPLTRRARDQSELLFQMIVDMPLTRRPAYIGQWLRNRRLDKNRSGEYRFSE